MQPGIHSSQDSGQSFQRPQRFTQKPSWKLKAFSASGFEEQRWNHAVESTSHFVLLLKSRKGTATKKPHLSALFNLHRSARELTSPASLRTLPAFQNAKKPPVSFWWGKTRRHLLSCESTCCSSGGKNPSLGKVKKTSPSLKERSWKKIQDDSSMYWCHLTYIAMDTRMHSNSWLDSTSNSPNQLPANSHEPILYAVWLQLSQQPHGFQTAARYVPPVRSAFKCQDLAFQLAVGIQTLYLWLVSYFIHVEPSIALVLARCVRPAAPGHQLKPRPVCKMTSQIPSTDLSLSASASWCLCMRRTCLKT